MVLMSRLGVTRRTLWKVDSGAMIRASELREVQDVMTPEWRSGVRLSMCGDG